MPARRHHDLVELYSTVFDQVERTIAEVDPLKLSERPSGGTYDEAATHFTRHLLDGAPLHVEDVEGWFTAAAGQSPRRAEQLWEGLAAIGDRLRERGWFLEPGAGA